MNQALASSDCLYQVLGLSKDADVNEVKTAYRTIAKQYHPDRISATASKLETEQATAIFNRATEAHAILGNAKQKAVYDRFGPNAATQSLNTWRNSGAYAGGVSKSKPFWKVAARAWIPMLAGTMFTTALVLNVQWDTKNRRETGVLQGQHAHLTSHQSSDINQRIAGRREGIRSGENPKAQRIWGEHASVPRPGSSS